MKKTYLKHYFTFAIMFTGLLSFAQSLPVMNPIQGPAAVCSEPVAEKTYTASASGTPMYYNWTYAGPSGGVTFGSASSSITTVSFSYLQLNATYTLYCTATNIAGTSPTKSFVVTVYETPTITFSGAQSICQGGSTNLSASSTMLSSSSTLTYSWSPSTGLSSTTGHSVIAQPANTTNYSVLLTLGTCTNVAPVTIVVNPCVVGINSLEPEAEDLLSVFPNPNSGSFVIKPGKDTKAFILNEIGQTVRAMNLVAGTETKISDLPGGIYFVITSDTRKKIVVVQ